MTLLLLLPIAIRAQDRPGDVSGHIVNARGGEAIGLVQVQIAGTAFTAVTSDDGTFHIAGIPAGTYTLQTSAVGYQVVYQDFTLAPGETKRFEVVLSSTTTALTDSAQVTADAFATPEPSASGFTLQGEERKNLASVLADDPLRAIQSLPGVTANDDFSSEFSVRGAPFGRVGLYLDGVLLHSPFHTTNGSADDGSLTIFNGDLTDDMTLYQGAWPVRYANRTAGVLSVETREGTRQEMRAQFSASASNAGALVEGPLGKDKRGSWLVAVRKSYLQYILNRIDFGDQAPFAFGFTDGQARLDYDLTPTNAVSLTLLQGDSSVDRSRFRSELSPTTVMTSDFQSSHINGGWRFASPKLLLRSHLAWSREAGDVGNRDGIELSKQHYGEWTARSDGSFVWTKTSTLEFGGEFHHVQQSGLSTQLTYAPALTSTRDAFDGSAHQTGEYIQESFQRGELGLAAGVRHDAHSQSGVGATSPYASASINLAPKTHLQLDWGRYSQFPEMNQYLSEFADGTLLPERSTHYEATLEQRLNERTRVRFEVYDRQDRDLLARPELDPRVLADGTIVQALPTALLTNSEHGHARGAEFVVQRRTANGLTGWISYAYAHATVTDDVLHLSFASDYDQRHTVNAYLSRRLRPTVNVSGRFTYGSGMPLPGFYQLSQTGQYSLSQARNALRAPFYERTDVRLNKDFAHRSINTTVYAEIVNVTNHRNRDFDSAGSYDPATGSTVPNFYSMFPVLPSVGIVMAF